jgi:hypothetical protein
MGSLPLARAGVGSAVNDTTRELGGAVGVAVIGSVFSSAYGTKIAEALRGRPGSLVADAKSSVGAALALASRQSDADGRAIADAARQAFVDGFHTAVLVGAATTAAGILAVLVFLPSRPSRADVERQAEEFAAEQERELAAAVNQVSDEAELRHR